MKALTKEEREERDKKLIDLYVNHPEMTLMEIASSYGIGEGALHKILTKNNIPRKRPKGGSKPSPGREERDKKIIDLYINHPEMTVEEIAASCGVGKTSVREALIRNNIPRNRHSANPDLTEEERKERNKKIIDLYVNHPEMTIKEIGSSCEVKRGTVHRVLTDGNIPRERQRIIEEEKEKKLIDLYVNHPEMTSAEIALSCKVGLTTLYRVLIDNGIPRERQGPTEERDKKIVYLYKKYPKMTKREIGFHFGIRREDSYICYTKKTYL